MWSNIAIGLGISGGISLLGVFWGIGTYNTLAGYIQDIKEMIGNMSAEYQRRLDLFMRLAEGVKSMKKQEKEVLTEVVKLRSQLGDKDIGKKAKAIKRIDTILNGLKINVEAYPNLTSQELHKDLMKEVRITEDRITVARTSYNETVNQYNYVIVTFPSKVIAEMFGFKAWTYYIGQEENKVSPELGL